MAEMGAQTARDLKAVMRTFGQTKLLKAAITKAPTDGSGTFTAMVSPFGPPPDSVGDIISPGAYSATIMDAVVRNPGELWTLGWNTATTIPTTRSG